MNKMLTFARESENPSHAAKKRANLTISLLNAVCLFFLPGINFTRAQVNLDYTPNDGNYISNDAYVSCNMSYISSANCGGGWGGDTNLNGSHNDGTAFYQRLFTDSSGNKYFQVIVGDYKVDDFALEYIIRTGDAGDGNWESGWSGTIPRSSSAGNPNDRTFNVTKPYDTATILSTDSGTGTGNPNRVIIRQLLSDAGSSQEFLKDQFDKKPLIHQTTSNAGIVTDIKFDMRGKTYADGTAIDAGTKFTNKTTLLGSARQGDTGDYDNSTNPTATPHLTAGAFIYSPGTGANDFGDSNGSYTYAESGFGDFFDPDDKEYVKFCDPSQNTNWSGHGACTNGDGGGGGSGGWGW